MTDMRDTAGYFKIGQATGLFDTVQSYRLHIAVRHPQLGVACIRH
jgi:hypothetical protein